MSDGMGREFTYLSSHATNRYFIPNWGIYSKINAALQCNSTRSEWNWHQKQNTMFQKRTMHRYRPPLDTASFSAAH